MTKLLATRLVTHHFAQMNKLCDLLVACLLFAAVGAETVTECDDACLRDALAQVTLLEQNAQDYVDRGYTREFVQDLASSIRFHVAIITKWNEGDKERKEVEAWLDAMASKYPPRENVYWCWFRVIFWACCYGFLILPEFNDRLRRWRMRVVFERLDRWCNWFIFAAMSIINSIRLP